MDYNESHFRQTDFITESHINRHIVIIGAGGIGSPTALAIAKMGFRNIHVYDADTVEAHNTGAQLYGPTHVDMAKVDALQQAILSLTGNEIVPHIQMVDEENSIELTPETIVISGLDSMAARTAVWNTIKDKAHALYIDGRMGLDSIRIFTTAAGAKRYENSLYPDSEGEPLACSAQSVSYNGMFCGSVIAAVVSDYVRNYDAPAELIGDLSLFGLSKA